MRKCSFPSFSLFLDNSALTSVLPKSKVECLARNFWILKEFIYQKEIFPLCFITLTFVVKEAGSELGGCYINFQLYVFKSGYNVFCFQ